MIHKKIRLAFIFIIILSGVVYAHPHVFIKTRTGFVFSRNSLAGVEVSWSFDSFFSGRVIMGCDRNKDRKFSASELRKVYKGFFSRLKLHNYFIYIWINNSYFRNIRISNFRARINAARIVTYSFFIKINTPLTARKKTVKLMYKDKTIFVAFYADVKSGIIKGIKPRVVKALNNKRAQYQVEFQK